MFKNKCQKRLWENTEVIVVQYRFCSSAFQLTKKFFTMNGESSPLFASDNQRKNTPILINMINGTAVVVLLSVETLSEVFKIQDPSDCSGAIFVPK